MRLRLRAADWEDRQVLFDWANDPDTRAQAFESGPIGWEGHLDWLRTRLSDPNCTRIFIAEGDGGAQVGQIRFDRSFDAAEIDYSVTPDERGSGLGVRLIESGCRRIHALWPDVPRVVALVKRENLASMKSFERAGFREVGAKDPAHFEYLATDARFVVATSHAWNEPMVSRLNSRVRGSFDLIRSRDELTLDVLRAINPRYVFFPHWSWIIPEKIYSRFDCIVFHMTDLPFGRGGSPLQNLIVRGISETKISAIVANSGVDTGDVLLKRPLALHGSAEEIYLRAADVIEEMIQYIVEHDPEGDPQHGEVVVFQRRRPEDSAISGVETLDQLFDHIRMLDAEGYPHAFLDVGPLTFRFTRASRKHGRLVTECTITLRGDE